MLNDLCHAVACVPLTEPVDGAGVERTDDHPTPFAQRLVLCACARQVIQTLDAIAHRPHETLEVTDVYTTPDRATVDAIVESTKSLYRTELVNRRAIGWDSQQELETAAAM